MVVPPILEERVETRDARWSLKSSSIWSAPTCLVVNPRYALKAFSVILAWIPRSFGTDAGDAVRDDAPRKELHREFAVLRFLRGPPGGGGEGGGLLVPIGAGAGQEVRRAGPGDRRVERHRQWTHTTCTIWFVRFIFFRIAVFCPPPSHFPERTLGIARKSAISLDLRFNWRVGWSSTFLLFFPEISDTSD